MENKRYTSKRIENSFAIYLCFRRFHKFVAEILFWATRESSYLTKLYFTRLGRSAASALDAATLLHT